MRMMKGFLEIMCVPSFVLLRRDEPKKSRSPSILHFLCHGTGKPVTTRNYPNPNKVQDVVARIILARVQKNGKNVTKVHDKSKNASSYVFELASLYSVIERTMMGMPVQPGLRVCGEWFFYDQAPLQEKVTSSCRQGAEIR